MIFFEMLFGRPISTIRASELNDRLKSGKRPLVVDVRRPDEYKTGHIVGAILIPLNEISSRMRELPRNREIVCVCASGNRSGSATRMLVKTGFNAVNMKGGMNSWRRANLPVKKGNAA